MAIKLDEMEKAAERFAQYIAKTEAAEANPEAVAELVGVAERHRKQFLPPAERLSKRATPATMAVVDALVVTTEPAASGDPAAAAVVPLVVTKTGLIPEVMQRDNDLRPIRFLHVAVLAARAVGRIRISDSPGTDEGDATGFLVAPGLLMTNWHVLKTEDWAAAGAVVFDDEDGLDGNPLETKSFRLQPDRLYVSDETLDYAIVEVSPRTSSGIDLATFGYLRLFEQTGKLDPTRREAANIVQHPGGGPKKIALRDNYVAPIVPDSVDPQKSEISLFYGTDTLKGSSGSPVCSDQWYVVALHRGGVPETKLVDGRRVVVRINGDPAVEGDPPSLLRYVTNEGTRISRIYHSLREKAAAGDAHAAAALERIRAVAADPRLGPLSTRTTPILLPGLAGPDGGGVEEITRRRAERFAGALGYGAEFLGDRYRIALPEMTSEVAREVAKLRQSDEFVLKYDHYSLVMNRERRTAFFIAGNIDGRLLWGAQRPDGLPNRPPWSFDPRMEEAFQPDDAIFSSAMQRGHLFKREDAVWGADEDAMRRADDHSFTITNATPMIANFNNKEWGDLEDVVTRAARESGRFSYFAGPVFRSTDRFFNELRANVPPTERRKGMRVPESFWKIVAWVENSTLRAAGFILHQTDEIQRQGPITEEIDFGKYRPVPVQDIEQATGLRFPVLAAADTRGR